jgi:hypothetical protein
MMQVAITVAQETARVACDQAKPAEYLDNLFIPPLFPRRWQAAL